FMLKVLVDYPSALEEFAIVERVIGTLHQVQEVLAVQHLVALQRATRAVFVDAALIEYAVRLAKATREPAAVGLPHLARYVTFGASPRASIFLALAAQALAVVRGRDYALPEDMRALAPDVLRHRLVLSYEALGDGVTADHLLDQILHAVPPPEVVLRRAAPGAGDEREWAPPPR
ncbi:MAG: AAA family ATPase, partial [Actinomycetes bacterium]